MNTNSPAPTTSLDTRQRILEAAQEIFAQEGFARATVRDICQRAGANIAAVNYHFGDKEKLYAEVLLDAYRTMMERHPTTMGLAPDAPPEARLEGFVRAFCRRLYGTGPESRLGWLMVREMVEPSPALDQVVQTMVRPQQEQLAKTLHELLGPAAPEELRRQAMGLVMGQIMFFHHCRAVVDRLFPDRKGQNPDPERLAEAITAFSLSGLKTLRAQFEGR